VTFCQQFEQSIAASDAYRNDSLTRTHNIRMIELQALLGRAPRNQAEIAEHDSDTNAAEATS